MLGLLPPKWEGMSNSILEYMASGLPVVATDVGGVRDLVIPDNTGYLVPSDDAPALAKRLMEINNEPAKGRAMGASGKKLVYNNCEFMDLARKTEHTYKDILSKKTARHRKPQQ